MKSFFKRRTTTTEIGTALTQGMGEAQIAEESGNGGGAVIGGEEEIDAEQAAGECRNENTESVKLTEILSIEHIKGHNVRILSWWVAANSDWFAN